MHIFVHLATEAKFFLRYHVPISLFIAEESIVFMESCGLEARAAPCIINKEGHIIQLASAADQ